MRPSFSNLATVLALLTVVGATAASAEAPGVAALIAQGHYWQSKGRQDLANQAFRRALALDPGNAEARAGMANPAPARATTPQPRRAAPQPAALAPVAPARPARSTIRPVSAPVQTAAPGNGTTRAAGFRSLEAGDLAAADGQFQRALRRNRRDADALGGLGLVRLRQSRFGEARDLLQQASQLGAAAKWAEALASARYFGGLAEARNALSQGRLAEAQSQAEALVRSGYPDRGPALELLGEVYEKQGRYADAADLYRQGSEGNTKVDARLQSRAARDRALQAVAQGDDATAQSEFVSGLMLDQRDPWIRYEFARYLLQRGRQAEVDSLVSSLSSSPDPDWLYAAALLNAQMEKPGAAYNIMGRIPQEQQSAQMRSFVTGLTVDNTIARSKTLAAGGKQSQGLAALRQLTATPGMSADKQAWLADALYNLGDTNGAASLAQQVLSRDITDPAAFEPIVRVLTKTGNDALAMSAAQRAARMTDGSPQGQATIGRLKGIMAASQAERLRLAGQYASAFDLLQSTWNDSSGNPEVLGALARLYQSGGLSAQAAQTFQLVLKQTPNDKGALMGLVETAGAAGDRDLARDALGRALQIAPDDYEIYLAAARMEQARGNNGAALGYLKRARAIYSRSAGLGTLTEGNPFGTTGQGNNPFRNRPQGFEAQAPVNPFALGKGTRVPGSGLPPSTYPSPGPDFTGQSPYVVTPAGWPASEETSPGWPVPSTSQGAWGGQSAPAAPASHGLVYPSDEPGGTDSGFGDPEINRIQAQIDAISQNSGPRADVRTGYRERSGETGLSALKEVSGAVDLSTSFAGGRISGRAEAVALDADRPTGSGLARFGRNGIAEAQGIVAKMPSKLTQADTQHASGVALSIGYEGPAVQAQVGTTPIGFEDTKIVWRVAATPRFSPNATGRVWFERQAVTDSVTSYAGTRDPVTGQFWGQVMRTGGGASFSYDKDNAGIYADASYNRYRGANVRNNNGLQFNVGGYLPLYRGQNSSLVAGTNVNYQNYANNQNYFSFGHGGYFSPQSFFSISFPVRYSYEAKRLHVKAAIAPGYQSYNQEQIDLFPTDPAAQALLNSLKAQDADVRNYYDSLSKTGFALSAEGSIYYDLSSRTRIGGEMSINTFGNYDEFKSIISIKQSLGGN
jgi:Flp pilus assembly protein TadD